jgi:hypothetical protein
LSTFDPLFYDTDRQATKHRAVVSVQKTVGEAAQRKAGIQLSTSSTTNTTQTQRHTIASSSVADSTIDFSVYIV